MIKKLLLLLLCITTCEGVFAGSAFYFKVKVATSPVGQGKVYATNTEATPSESQYADSVATETWSASGSGDAAPSSVHLFAQPNDGYVFSYWTNEDGDKLSDQFATVSLSSTSKDKDHPKIFNYTAHFATAGNVVVYTNDPKLGSASIDKPSNQNGDEVTLTASSDFFISTFKGWQKEGSDELITQNPYTFTVTESAKYTAVFQSNSGSGAYFMVQNVNTGHYFGLFGVKEDHIGSDQRYLKNSVMLVPEGIEHKYAGFVVKVEGITDNAGGLEKAKLSAQGVNTYDIASHNYFKISKRLDNQYMIYASTGGYTGYLLDWNDTRTLNTPYGTIWHPGLYNVSDMSDTHHDWRFFPLTEQTMDKYYFGAAPEAKMQKDGKYYTSMYTAFPYKCMDGVKAYYVSGFDADGNANLTEIISGKVPAGTGVILECNGLDAKDNRLIPLTEDVPALSTTNYLKGCIQLNGQDSTMNSQATMRVFNTGSKGIGFYKYTEGKALVSNKAYLDVTDAPHAKAAILLNFESVTNGIETIESPVENIHRPRVTDNYYYDLQGRRVEHPSHGIYIKNGKKIIL